MEKPSYTWTRFWHPRGATIHVLDGGFLPDPEDQFSQAINPDVVPFDKIDEKECLALLGEPGAGKTHSIKAAYESTKQYHAAVFVPLSTFDSGCDLHDAICNHPKTTSWVKSTEATDRLFLFLDSLDEGRLKVEQIAEVLSEIFRSLPRDRLSLRITCRTAEWPEYLESTLRELWGESFKPHEIAPLRRRDVELAARDENIDPENFLRHLAQREAVPLAIKPLTLKFLVKIYGRTQELPQRKSDLYWEGCRSMCEEPSPSRRARKRQGLLSKDKRLIVAGRIAALSIFGNCTSVWTGPSTEAEPDSDLLVEDVIGGSENDGDEEFKITPEAVAEALSTGLFSGGEGAQRLTWAHYSFAEFLAAWYVARRNLALPQTLALLTNPKDHSLVPQLHETAAWIATLMPDAFRRIGALDPLVLLQSDVSNVGPEDRENLVDSLLVLHEKQEPPGLPWGRKLKYAKLNHPRLADQLRPYIVGKRNLRVRQVAVDIADSCQLNDLQGEVVALALDTTEPYELRVAAAYAIRNLADDGTKRLLQPLVLGQSGDDPDDQLKGCALHSLWPNHLSPDDVFTSLTHPKNPSLGGAYSSFISKLVEHLRPPDLLPALNWVLRTGPYESSRFDDLEDAVLRLAWESVDDPIVTPLLAEAISRRLRGYLRILKHSQSEFRALVAADKGRRRVLLESLVGFVSEPDVGALGFNGLATKEDLPWLLERAVAEASPQLQSLWFRLAETVFDPEGGHHLNRIYEMSHSNGLLKERFSWLLDPIQLDSEQAKTLRKRYQEEQEWSHPQHEAPANEVPQERIAELLLLAESGDLDAFWRLNYWMLFEADGTSHITESYTDLTRLPGWQSADVQTQMRILEAAKHYLSQGDPATSEWLGTDKWDRRAVAGCRAFHLLYQMDSGYLNDLEPGIWRRWTPAIVAWHWGSESHVERALVQSAYKHAPKEVLEALQMLLGDGHSSNSAVRAVECIEDSWDTSIEEVFFNSLEQLGLLSESGRFLLRVLLRHNCEKARSLAEGEISSLSEPGSESFERALVAGTSLFFQSPDCGWPALWPAITTDDGFGRALVERIAREPLYGSETEFPNRLSEKDLAEFYILLEGLYPHAQHPALTRPWIPEGTVSGLKSHVLAGLRSRGTWRACEQLRRIAQAFPEIENLKWILVQAERTTRERTWVRVRPKDLLSLTRGSDKRLVRDGDELLEATIESLRRFEQHLHRANTPTIGRLWNQKPVTPKDESNLSNEVKMHLDEDLRRRGIIVNREVEVRSPAGGV